MSFLWDFFCCIRHGKQVKLEKLEGSSFAYKSCHSESGFFLFFTQKLFLFWISPRKWILYESSLSSQCCFWATKRSVGGAEAMLLILSTFCSLSLVACSSGRKKKQLVIQELLQERTCISFCSFCRSAEKRIERSSAKRRKNLIALPYTTLMMAQNTYCEARWPIKKSTKFSYAWE